MGTATDPYQPCEGRYRLTRGVVGALADFANPLSILTKSTLVLRDLDVFRRLDAAAGLTVSMSVATLDERIRRVVEPGTPPGRSRLEALAACAGAGIEAASPIVLHVRANIREHFLPWLEAAYPWLYPRYVELYGKRAYAPKAYAASGRPAQLALAV